MSLRKLDRFRRSIGFRLILWYAGMFIVCTSFLFALAYMFMSSSADAKNREDVHLKLEEYAAQYRAGGLERLERETDLEERSGEAAFFFVRLADPQNHTVFLDNPNQWSEFDLKEIENIPASKTRRRLRLQNRRGDNTLEIESTLLPDGMLLQIGKSTDEARALLMRFRRIFAVFMAPVILLGIAAGWFSAYRALRPIRSLVQTIQSIMRGQIQARVPAGQIGDELDELVGLFNGMVGKIETLINGMRGSLDNVAHDLRTPMMRLRGTAEMALRSEGELETCREALADCVEESDRILTMLNTLMDISEAETGAMKLSFEPVDISDLMEDAAELYKDVAEEKGIALRVAPPQDLWLSVDRNRMQQVLANLLDNAVKYTPRGGRIDLEAMQREQETVLTIRDTGLGISQEEIPKIWDRLYRGDQSRTQRGLGLGLSLVKAVVQAHHGWIEVSSQPGIGSQFTLRLPTASAHST